MSGKTRLPCGQIHPKPFASVISIYSLFLVFSLTLQYILSVFCYTRYHHYLITTKYQRQTASVPLLLLHSLLSFLEYLYTLWRTHIFACHTKYTIFFSNHKGFLLRCRMPRRI